MFNGDGDTWGWGEGDLETLMWSDSSISSVFFSILPSACLSKLAYDSNADNDLGTGDCGTCSGGRDSLDREGDRGHLKVGGS